MKNLSLILLALFFAVGSLYAQDRTIQGQITDEAGEALIGANVILKGSDPIVGTVADLDGNYELQVSGEEVTLIFSFAGFTSQEVVLGTDNNVDVTLTEGVNLEKVVVTALGISRAEKSLGYATQQVDGEDVNKAREVNLVNALQGKIAGVQITGSSNLGGSSRIIMRGASSVLGNNQPLFVVDGVPVDNSNYTSTNQARGAGGYDYGNAIQDLNPDDIETINVLKGATAAALYGDRAANGVIIITTKKGTGITSKKMPIGVSINSSVQFNEVYVLPKYQNMYGGGAGDFFLTSGLDTNQQTVQFDYDGSWGPKLDGQMVRHWDSYDEWDTDNYGQLRAWSPSEGNVKDFFRMGITAANNVSFGGANNKGAFRMSFTNTQQQGTQENSRLNRNNVSLTSSLNLTDKLSARVNINYVNSRGHGRPLSGYGESVMSQFNQWFQRQLDMDRLRDYKNPDGTMRTWNRYSETDPSPNYWDNPFWERYENGQDDRRDRIFGNIGVTYKFTDWLSFTARAMTDFYTDRREEWIAVGGVRQPYYSEDVRFQRESNYDGILSFNKNLGEIISLSALVGVNFRRNVFDRNYASTQGGLNTPGLYNLSNSASEVAITDFFSEKEVFSVFQQVTLGIKGMVFVDLTNRTDINSTLPTQNNVYDYYSANVSFVFSELLPNNNILSFGKFRGGYASVGNGTDPYNLYTVYNANSNFGSNGTSTVPDSKNNSELKPEVTSSLEAGLDIRMFKNRFGFDVSYYNNTTRNQIFRVSQSAATGYSSRFLNAGKVLNHGIELMAYGTPVKTKNFRWDVGFNFAKNYNKVLELYTGTDNISLSSLFGVTLEARVGETYGTIMGYDYVYDDAGNKLVDEASGTYFTTDEIVPLGSVLADFTGGLSTTLSFKGFSLYVLFDFQAGGSLFSLSNTWGKYSGLTEETVAETTINGTTANIRDHGIVVDGVIGVPNGDGTYTSNGVANTTAVDAQSHFFLNQGYIVNAADVYDASYIKFREARLSYTFPSSIFEKTPFQSITLAVVGRNLAILHKNIPNVDPEAALSTGNIQGFEGGQLPTERSIGVNLNIKF